MSARNMIDYFFVKTKKGKIEREFIPADEIKLKGDLFESNPLEMIGLKTNIGFGSSDGVRDVFWDDLEAVYNDWGKFGSFGDWMLLRRELTASTYKYELVMIAREAWNKAASASDLLPFFYDDRGNYFFVGIYKEDKETGIKYKALIGGICDVKGAHLDNALECIIREAEEEASILIEPSDEVACKSSPIVEHAEVMVYDKDHNLISEERTSFDLCGNYWTGDDEINQYTGLKRVSYTLAYTFAVDLKSKAVFLETMFKAGDDAVDIFVWNATCGEVPEFRSANHTQIYNEALEFHGIG